MSILIHLPLNSEFLSLGLTNPQQLIIHSNDQYQSIKWSIMTQKLVHFFIILNIDFIFNNFCACVQTENAKELDLDFLIVIQG